MYSAAHKEIAPHQDSVHLHHLLEEDRGILKRSKRKLHS